MYPIFALVGLAWAAIHVYSLPMVVELCPGSRAGRFTGYDYAFSMAVQVITPILSSWLLRTVGDKILFPYAAFFTLLVCLVRHGDNRPGGENREREYTNRG